MNDEIIFNNEELNEMYEDGENIHIGYLRVVFKNIGIDDGFCEILVSYDNKFYLDDEVSYYTQCDTFKECKQYARDFYSDDGKIQRVGFDIDIIDQFAPNASTLERKLLTILNKGGDTLYVDLLKFIDDNNLTNYQ